MQAELSDKLTDLRRRIAELESVVVAFSAGIDSTLLLRVAVGVLGAERVLAVTGRSPSIPRAELAAAAELARECGAPHTFLDTAEFDDPNYTANPNNRCYYCKQELFGRLRTLANERGYRTLVSGANADDRHDYRPGQDAAREQAVVAPLADANITKSDIRTLAAHFGLSIHDKPAAPCLSSRIPYGEPVTPEKLARIDAAETFLRSLGFTECRVRHHTQVARIEVPPAQLARFADAALCAQVDAHLRSLGFPYVALDLRGFRSGSLNEPLLGAGMQAAARSADRPPQ